jgi:PAS domain S-box-containing protein
MLTTKSMAGALNPLRPSGISAIGDVRWGTHFCHFYETKQDLLDTLIPYFKAGLENNEFCLWVVSRPLTVAAAKRALGQAVPDLDCRHTERSLEIHRHDDWYLHNGYYEPERVIQGWLEKLEQALAKGYAGMRVSGDTSWVHQDQWRGFCEYEKQFDAVIAHQQMIVLCTYPLTTSPAAQIFDAARIHQVAVARRHGRWEMVETPELKQAKAEIERLNNELEQRVIERIRELEAANEALKRQIIERKEAERQSRLVIDAIPHQIWSGAPDGTLDYCNDRWRSYMGITLADLQGDGWQTMLHPEDRDRVLKAWHESVANGTPYEQEARHRGADGTYRWFLTRGVPLRDTEGRIVRWYGTNTDIEDRTRAEATLRQREEHLRVLLENVPVAVYTCNREGLIEYYNPKAIEMWGRAPVLRDTMQRYCGSFALFHTDGTPMPFEDNIMAQVIKTGIPQRNQEVVIGRPDGTRVIALVNVAPLRSERGELIGAVNCILDISARKQAEEALKNSNDQLRALSGRLQSVREEEATRISREIHDELGQKLTGLKMDLRRAERKLEEFESSSAVNSLLDTLVSATELTDEIIATVQEIAANLRPGVLDKLGLGAALHYEGRRFQERTGISCEVSLPETEPVFSTEVSTALFRIFQECLTNIMRHARATKVEASLKLEDGCATLRVQDNGRGITETEIANPESLGLLGMKERTALLGGEIVFQRDSQSGTIVTARLPQSGTLVQTKGLV